MVSFLEDEFGDTPIRCFGRLSEGPGPDDAWQLLLSCSDAVPVSIRIREMQHFLSLLSLFDPQFNTKKDGLSQIVSQTPPWSQNP